MQRTRANAKQRADQIYRHGQQSSIRSLVKLNANDRGRSTMDIFRVKDGKIAEYRDIVQGIPKKRKRRYCVLNLARFRAKSSVKFVKLKSKFSRRFAQRASKI